jgi:hypothetical protein
MTISQYIVASSDTVDLSHVWAAGNPLDAWEEKPLA